MAADPIRDAFRAKLQAILTAGSITWAIEDTGNTADNPDAAQNYFELEFMGSTEAQASFGSPGNNFFYEEGQVSVHVIIPLGRKRDEAERYALIVQRGFRGVTFATADSRNVRITTTGSLGGGQTMGGMWAETIALSYLVTNTG
jgi:hypothetical protein